MATVTIDHIRPIPVRTGVKSIAVVVWTAGTVMPVMLNNNIKAGPSIIWMLNTTSMNRWRSTESGSTTVQHWS